MSSIVLKSISAENFAPFADKVVFTTEIENNKDEYKQNTFTWCDYTLNKVSYVYGANGSGKTYFCKILREIQRLIDWSPLSSVNNAQILALPQLKGLDGNVPSFAYDVAYCTKPTKFSIDIGIDNTMYHYEFSVLGKSIQSELLTKKFRRTEKLLVRTSPQNKDIELRSEFKSLNHAKNVIKEEALCLPMLALLNNSLANQIVDAIGGIHVLNMAAPRLRPAESEDSFSDERMEKYVNILKKADPTLRKMRVSFKEGETARQQIEDDDFENREIITTKTTVAVSSEHAVYENGVETDLKAVEFFRDESLGTTKLFTALPQLYDILETGGIVFLDEIENGLHISLVREIIQLFINPQTNPNNAQLICTSHQPLLVKGDVRRDQVWVASKDSCGKSTLNRISSLKTSRTKFDISNKLLEGALGYNPDFFFEELR